MVEYLTAPHAPGRALSYSDDRGSFPLLRHMGDVITMARSNYALQDFGGYPSHKHISFDSGISKGGAYASASKRSIAPKLGIDPRDVITMLVHMASAAIYPDRSGHLAIWEAELCNSQT